MLDTDHVPKMVSDSYQHTDIVVNTHTHLHSNLMPFCDICDKSNQPVMPVSGKVLYSILTWSSK